MDKKIFVTKPFLPPLSEYIPYLESIWESGHLTNNGPYHQQLEAELCRFLGVKHISIFGNGTIALMVAIKALGLSGEIITTPYSFVASSHAITWNDIKPVFVDINRKDCNINPEKINAAITDRTTAILPVHVYGNPCKHEGIKKIAREHNLKIIYDAAHAFGVQQNGQSILNWGDLSVLSFHATKVFNTLEGGAIVSNTAEMKKKIDDLKNFGFQDEVTVEGIGINGKMNEMQAAMGLLQLKHVNQLIDKRKQLSYKYREGLKDILGLEMLEEEAGVTYNYGYFPILISKATFGKSRDQVFDYLRKHNIFSRRYFFPLISEYSEYKKQINYSKSSYETALTASEKVICLPLYPELSEQELDVIINLIRGYGDISIPENSD